MLTILCGYAPATVSRYGTKANIHSHKVPLTTGRLTSKVVLAEGNGLLATVWSACAPPHRGSGLAIAIGLGAGMAIVWFFRREEAVDV